MHTNMVEVKQKKRCKISKWKCILTW